MGNDLAIALAIFLVSAATVVFFGGLLAKYGDALARLTGWGHLFVGSILVALATSLPELSINISAVRLELPNPELALGNILGANMANMFVLSLVALLFGGKRFLQRVSPEQGYLIVLAAIMTGAAVLLAAIKLDVSLWSIGLSSVILLIVYVVGMRAVYVNRPSEGEGDAGEGAPGITLGRAWLMFSLVSGAVIVTGYFLAYSADRVAEITGVASSTLGILVVSLVTTLPEVATTTAAARIGAMDLGVGNLYGSCIFNVTILSFADPFYRQGILVNQSEPAHLVAGGIALGLILLSLVLILGRNRLKGAVAVAVLALMASIYVVGGVVVATLGTTGEVASDSASASSIKACSNPVDITL